MSSLFGLLSLVCSVFFLVALFLLEDSYALKPLVYWSELGAAGVFFVLWIVSGGAKRLSGQREKRILVFTSGSLLYLLLVLPAVVAVNYLVVKKELFFIDFSEEQVYTLSPQSKKILDSLEHDVTFQYFRSEPATIDKEGQKEFEEITELLERISKAQPLIKVEVLDPEKNIRLVEKLRITEDSTLHITYEDGRWAQIAERINEQEIFNALKRLIINERPKIYFTGGFGEGDLQKDFYPLLFSLEGDSFEILLFDISQGVKLPEDAACLVILAPRRPYTPEATGVIEEYLARGGSVMVFDEPRYQNNLNEIFAAYGVSFGKEIVVRPAEFDGEVQLDLPITQLGAHEISSKVEGVVKLATAQVVDVSESKFLTPLMFAPYGSWEEVDEAASFSKAPYKATRSLDERIGSLPVAAITLSDAEVNKMVLFGDVDFIALKNISVGFNKQMVLSALNWLVGQEDFVDIKARSIRENATQVSDEVIARMFLFSSLLFPQLLICIGVWVWWRR